VYDVADITSVAPITDGTLIFLQSATTGKFCQ
jgi:hypothetical protein